ncbi:MAG: glycosyltransferase [Bacteroidota bacterium]
MIPKIIHYFWLGKTELPADLGAYVAGWKRVMPNYEFRFWHDGNLDLSLRYLERARINGKYANAVNFLRLYVLHRYGGIYLDTDVEVLQPFDEILATSFFCGQEKSPREAGRFVNNAVLGAVAGHPLLWDTMLQQLRYFDGLEAANLSAPVLLSCTLRNYLMTKQSANYPVRVHPPEVFYPYAWNETLAEAVITERTLAIHHWSHTWKEASLPPAGSLQRLRGRWRNLRERLELGLAAFLRRDDPIELAQRNAQRAFMDLVANHWAVEVSFIGAWPIAVKEWILDYAVTKSAATTNDALQLPSTDRETPGKLVFYSWQRAFADVLDTEQDDAKRELDDLATLNPKRDFIYLAVDQYACFYEVQGLQIALAERGWRLHALDHSLIVTGTNLRSVPLPIWAIPVY